MTRKAMLVFLLVFIPGGCFAGFDHTHGLWDGLLKKHIRVRGDGNASSVDYAGFQKDREQLSTYLSLLSGVSKETFQTWHRDRKLAFLINAYNAFTIELILKKYPDLKSIKESVGWFGNPWKLEFFSLLGRKMHLDYIEHELIREEGVYDEPLIHAALVCAARSCPPLREEAFTGDRLEVMLQDNLKRFLRDRERNWFDRERRIVFLSSVFKWYRADFSKGFRGYGSLDDFIATHAGDLGENREDEKRMAEGDFKIKFLKYDWGLNDVR